MRLLQGAGPVGLAAIPRRRGDFLRPLLDVTRAEIEAYLVERGLTPVRDPMNEDRRWLRARLRGEILPALRELNPRVAESLRRTACAASEVTGALDWAVEAAAEKVGGSASGLAALPALLAKRVLQVTIPVRWSARHLDAALTLARGKDGSASLDLPGGTLHREYDKLVFRPEHPTDVSVDIVGEGGPYAVRRWNPGDRMRLAGGTRKLQDVFTDRKVPRRLRADAVVVVRQGTGDVVWVEHVGSAFGEAVRVTLTRSHIPANSQ
jgi:tRNA(Ile)-lysidine synthase